MQAASDAGDGDEGEATVAARLAALLAADMPFVVAEAAADVADAGAGAGAGAGAAPSLPAGTFLGYACASSFRPREGWRFCCENSVYVSEGARRCGVGKCAPAAGAEPAGSASNSHS
jgi:hypothetical protein